VSSKSNTFASILLVNIFFFNFSDNKIWYYLGATQWNRPPRPPIGQLGKENNPDWIQKIHVIKTPRRHRRKFHYYLQIGAVFLFTPVFSNDSNKCGFFAGLEWEY